MDKIYIAMYCYGSYDSYTEVRLRAFPTFAEAEAHCHEDNAVYIREADLSHIVSQGMTEWRTKNPHPVLVAAKLTMPQWQGKKGSKKNAPPEVLREFKERENAARAEYERVGKQNEKLSNDWMSAALAESKRLMAEAGYTPEEVEARQVVIWSATHDERDYQVEEIPFGAVK